MSLDVGRKPENPEEEAEVNPHKHRENIKTPHRKTRYCNQTQELFAVRQHSWSLDSRVPIIMMALIHLLELSCFKKKNPAVISDTKILLKTLLWYQRLKLLTVEPKSDREKGYPPPGAPLCCRYTASRAHVSIRAERRWPGHGKPAAAAAPSVELR